MLFSYGICSSRFDMKSLVPIVILMSLLKYKCPKRKKIGVLLLFLCGVCVPTWLWSEQGLESKQEGQCLAQEHHTCQSHDALLWGAHKPSTYIWMFSQICSSSILDSSIRWWYWHCCCWSIICLVGRWRKTAWLHKSILEIIPKIWGYLWEVLDSSNWVL